MIYEKPEITFQKFHTDAFLDNTNVLSSNDPDEGHEAWDPDAGFGFGSSGYNGSITINSDGVGGWFNG